MSAARLKRILDLLNVSTGLYSGRVYGGGLAKFEPSDIARLRIPFDLLAEAPRASASAAAGECPSILRRNCNASATQS